MAGVDLVVDLDGPAQCNAEFSESLRHLGGVETDQYPGLLSKSLIGASSLTMTPKKS
jgi:hypothetical protein